MAEIDQRHACKVDCNGFHAEDCDGGPSPTKAVSRASEGVVRLSDPCACRHGADLHNYGKGVCKVDVCDCERFVAASR